MKSKKKVTTSPAESNPTPPEASSGTPKAKSRIRTHKREQRRLKAAISLLKEDLANSRDLADELNNKWLDERQRVKELLAEKDQITVDTMKAVCEAENKVHEASTKIHEASHYAINAFMDLTNLMTRLSKGSY